MPDDAQFEQFKRCVRIQAGLDLEAWDVILFQPLKDFSAWWSRQNESTKGYTGFLSGAVITAFTRWLARVAGIAAAEIAGLFAEALVAVLAGIALATFMDVVEGCLLMQA